MKLLGKPRDIKIVKRKKGEKVEIYNCDGLEFMDGKLYAVNCRKKLICIGNIEMYVDVK